MFLNPVVKHIFREVNQCTDALAKLGATFVASSVVFYNSPLMVENLLAFDNVELYILQQNGLWLILYISSFHKNPKKKDVASNMNNEAQWYKPVSLFQKNSLLVSSDVNYNCLTL